MKLFSRSWPAAQNAKDRLLLLHGMGGTGSLWRPLVAGLENSIFCLAPDQRGHGQSSNVPSTSRLPARFSPLDYGADLVELLEEEKFAPCYVLGHSMGVRSACALAHLKPKWVKGLILIDLGFSGAAGGGLGESLAEFLKDIPMNFASRAEARAHMGQHAPDPSMGQYLLAVAENAPDGSLRFPFDRAALIETIHAARDQSVRKWVEAYANQGGRALVLRGENSLVWSQAEFEREREHFRTFESIKFESFPGTGHGLPFEARLRLTERLLGFFAE